MKFTTKVVVLGFVFISFGLAVNAKGWFKWSKAEEEKRMMIKVKTKKIGKSGVIKQAYSTGSICKVRALPKGVIHEQTQHQSGLVSNKMYWNGLQFRRQFDLKYNRP